eukprot:1157300-Pelagomonas_calceolata.AAC.4
MIGLRKAARNERASASAGLPGSFLKEFGQLLQPFLDHWANPTRKKAEAPPFMCSDSVHCLDKRGAEGVVPAFGWDRYRVCCQLMALKNTEHITLIKSANAVHACAANSSFLAWKMQKIVAQIIGKGCPTCSRALR